VFAQVDRGVLTDMRSAILAAVIAWEPRIEVAGLEIVESGDDPGLLTISLSYVLRGANSRYNFVYPFYIREASGSARP
jgi:phage baseplate assembly protein W